MPKMPTIACREYQIIAGRKTAFVVEFNFEIFHSVQIEHMVLKIGSYERIFEQRYRPFAELK